MKGYLLLDGVKLGEVDFKVIDEGMGGIGGNLKPFDSYYLYQEKFRSICDSKGVANIEDFNFVIQIDGIDELMPAGGIGVTDIAGFDDIFIESAGINYDTIELMKAAE
jgi:hypothetical protein